MGQMVKNPSSEIDWFDLLAIQGTLRSLLQNHQFFGAHPSLWSNSHIHTWLLENHSIEYMDLCQQSDVSIFKYAF